MPSFASELLPNRGQCTQNTTCNCDAALFGPFYRKNPLNATELCGCGHAWWMHTVIIPSTTGPGGCHSTGCGGYYPTVTSLLSLERIRHSFRTHRVKEPTLRHAYVASDMTSMSNLSRLHPSPTPVPSSLVALQHVRMLTLPMRPHCAGTRPPRRRTRSIDSERTQPHDTAPLSRVAVPRCHRQLRKFLHPLPLSLKNIIAQYGPSWCVSLLRD